MVFVRDNFFFVMTVAPMIYAATGRLCQSVFNTMKPAVIDKHQRIYSDSTQPLRILSGRDQTRDAALALENNRFTDHGRKWPLMLFQYSAELNRLHPLLIDHCRIGH